MNKMVAAAALSLLALTACKNKDEIYANPPQQMVDGVEALMPAAKEFVFTAQDEALEQGPPLSEYYLDIAKELGVQYPEKVRVYYVDKLPSPTDPTLSQIAHKAGYAGSNMAGYTYGYGIWIANRYKNQRGLLEHELYHVKQAEELGLEEQTRQYLLQMYVYGYTNSPMEVDAREATSKYL